MAHANGDAAIGDAIDAFREALDPSAGVGLRHRIEHCSFATADQLEAMAALGVSPSFLENHVYYWGRAFRDDIVGLAKANRLDPFATAIGRGLRVSMHSDYRVTEFEPLRMVQTAVTRRMRSGGDVLNPDECVSVEAAMRAITIDAAWQLHNDDRLGSIEVGKYADLAVLDGDPFTTDPDGIAELQVLQTLVGGAPV